MEAYLRILGKPTPQFIGEIAPKVLLVGLGSVVFRDAVYTSHEVFIDDEQISWFENVAKTHPAEDGWKLFVFSHAPPMVSMRRVYALPLSFSDCLVLPTILYLGEWFACIAREPRGKWLLLVKSFW